MAKDFQNKSQHNGSNKGTSSDDMANQQGHTASYHKSTGNDQKAKK